ncbi:MAG TPA: phosphoenolpyruvate--protein phosphotransferase [Gemmatimonadaceae bacterium]|nr:phosphoenolpyruvate--protein phosphotransferase [Gemmatimonadaceae bacterium]
MASSSGGAAAAGAPVLRLRAPLSGVLVPLDEVPDAAFAQRLAGDGISIDPMSDVLVAPCDAQVVMVHRAGHALTLAAAGLELIIHIGLDTVDLRGQGFTPVVRAGDKVRTGDPLIRFDADLVARRARSLLTQVLVSNMERVGSLIPRTGNVVAGQDEVLEIRLATGGAGVAEPESRQTAESPPMVVNVASGLHARPAAVLAATARRHAADLRLLKGDREANLRSVVSIMALEVDAGDTVRIIGRGNDAGTAVAALVEALTSELAAAHPAAAGAAPSAPAAAAERPALPADGILRGVPASPGAATGNVHYLRHEDIVVQERGADPHQERRALDTAIAAAREQLQSLKARLEQDADAERAEIFAAHQELLEDPEVLDRATEGIRTGESAAFAWREAYASQAERLLALRSPLLAARASDLRDVGRRVLHLLTGHEAAHEIPPDSILVAEELAPSDVATIDRSRVSGFCTTTGSATSHVAILARGLGIPAVAGMNPLVLDIPEGTRVVLDGDAGTLRAAPTAAEEEAIARRREATAALRKSHLAAATQPATTRDGHRLEVTANIGNVADAERVPELGGEGVGLLRTEFLFMDRQAAPDEDEQTRTYEAIARALGPDRILVIRTLDVGGDKPLSYLPVAAEANPFLGERGIRLTLNRPELFRTQVRAILRASTSGKVAVMFPMVATFAEWRAARDLVERERAALGLPPIQIGIMVETAAAALMAGQFAREADFLSIGTNDLTQYTLAMDRTNPRLAPQLDALHPAVLRLIAQTVEGASAHGRWVGVCGALAGEVQAVPVLIGLGVHELSADLPVVPSVKARVRELTLEECRATAREALDAADGAEVRAIVARRHG